MPKILVLGLVILISASSVLCKPSRALDSLDYSKHRVIRIISNDEQTLSRSLRDISANYDVDVWSRSAQSADVMVGPAHFDDVQRLIKRSELTSKVVIDNVQQLLDQDVRERNRVRRAVPDVTNSYLRHGEMNDFLKRVAETATVAQVTLRSMGKSFQGRDTQYVKIQEKGDNRRDKHIIVIDAGIHAREWIAPAMALNIINKLAFNPENDPDVAEMLKMFDWVIAPNVNPDGYEYSHLSDRLWRKTRTNSYSTDSSCYGVDLNRNFGYDWDPTIGGSSAPCSDVYAGPSPFSELESKNIRDWLTEMKDKAKLYLTMHSYGQWMLYPYGSDMNKPRKDENLLISVGNAFADELNRRGRTYQVGNSAALLYPAAGGADDYAKGQLGISLSYTPELSPGPYGYSTGFVLSPSDIAPVVRDTWPGIAAMAKKVFATYGYPDQTATTTTTSTTTTTTTTTQSTAGINYYGSGGIVQVVINGRPFYLDSSNPDVQRWLYYYYRRMAG